MGNHWFVITKTNDPNGKEQQQIEYWADSTEFSVASLLLESEAAQAACLRHIFTLDAPRESPAVQIQFLAEHDLGRLVEGVVLQSVPIDAGTFRWVSHSVAHAQDGAPEIAGQLISDKYGVKLWRLNSPLDVDADAPHPKGQA